MPKCKVLHTSITALRLNASPVPFAAQGGLRVILPPDTRPVVPLHPVSEGSLAAEPSRKIVPTAML